ncbi:BrxA family protein [Lacticaseibacillus paracasei]|uniref:BrxA family protein n=1 Tax=Lacticaseibacillus paracasei TaxID=1597 RepID=UPI0034E853CF
MISMLNNGKDWDDITEAIIDDNIFKMSSKNRATDLKKEMFLRISSLPVSFIELFEQLPLNNQKIMNLIAIMNARPLVEDFVLDVVKKELLTGDLRTCLVSFKNYLQEGQYNHLKTAVKGAFTVFPKSPTFV